MQDKRLLLGALAVLLLILLGLGVLLFGGENKDVKEQDGDQFADTSRERDTDVPVNTLPDIDTTNPESTQSTTTEGSLPLLRRITSTPTAGAVALQSRKLLATAPVVRYVERANGNVFETPLDTIEEPIVLSRKTILRVGEAIWSPTGSTSAFRYQNDVGDILFTFLGNIATTTSTTSDAGLRGRPLPNDIVAVTFSPDGTSVAYLQPTDSGTILYTEPVVGGTRTEVATFPFRNLTLSWGGKSTIIAQMNPTPAATGVAWLVDTGKRSKTPIIGPAYTLGTVVSPAGDRVLAGFLEREGGFPSLRIIALKDATTVYLSLYTMYEKCSWGLSGRYVYCAVPLDGSQSTDTFQELWRQGRAASNDALWRFDTTSGTSERLVDPQTAVKRQFDIVEISVAPHEDFLVFKERTSDELWSLRLSQSGTTNDEQ